LKKFSLFVSCFALLSAPAWAAGAGPSNDHYDWSGYFAGANGGYADFDSSWLNLNDTRWQPNSHWDGHRFYTNSTGFDVGAQLGFNRYIAEDVVLGIEGTLDYFSTRKLFNGLGNPCNRGCVDVTNNLNGIATLRAKLGYAFDRLMPYATAGVALGNFKQSWIVFDEEDNSFDLPNLAVGWVAGAGVEYAVTDRISVFGEALYYGFSDITASSHNHSLMKVDRQPMVANIGLNFHF
jgi:opacity protein-like surface antigen